MTSLRPLAAALCRLCLGAGAALSPACLAYNPGSLQALSQRATPCTAPQVAVSDAHSKLGATFWHALCQGQHYSCAAHHNYDGPTQVVCRPAPAP